MSWRSWLFSVALLATAACDRHPVPAAAASAAPPAVQTPVGPQPGGDVPAPEAQNPFGADPIAASEGHELFLRYNCAGCHGDHGGGGMAPSLRDEDWLYGESDAHVFDSIAEGRAHGMPSWGVKLPGDQVWKLVAYIHTLRTPDEPFAPDQTIPKPPMP